MNMKYKTLIFTIIITLFISCSEDNKKSILVSNPAETLDPIIDSVSSVFGNSTFLTGTGDVLKIYGKNFNTNGDNKIWVYTASSIVDSIVTHSDTEISVIPQFISSANSYIKVLRDDAYGIGKYETIDFVQCMIPWGNTTSKDEVINLTKDDDDNIYYITNYTVAEGVVETRLYKIDTDNIQTTLSTEIGVNATSITAMGFYDDIIYYGKGKDIYLYDNKIDTPDSLRNNPDKIFSAPRGSSITGIEANSNGDLYLLNGGKTRIDVIDANYATVATGLVTFTEEPKNIQIIQNDIIITFDNSVVLYKVTNNALESETILISENINLGKKFIDATISSDNNIYVSYYNENDVFTGGVLQFSNYDENTGIYDNSIYSEFYSAAIQFPLERIQYGNDVYLYVLNKNNPISPISRINMLKIGK